MEQPRKINKRKWWQGASVYHIYPRSFYDSNGDGIGDLKGIADKLDYLAGKPGSLGVNAIWLSPFYKSPMADFGYDVSDYKAVDPIFGTMTDFERLLAKAHGRGLKVIVDFVPNHSSDQHAWFIESRSDRHNSKRDWYVWRDPARGGGPPNNWRSVFGGPAWQFDKHTGQYYLHSFLKQQPDLNWENLEVREAMRDVARFWMEKGVDGLRADAVVYISKDPKLRDEILNPDYKKRLDDPYKELIHGFSSNGPKLFDYLNEIVDVATSYRDRFIFTEAYPEEPGSISHYLPFYEKLKHNVCAPINFECISFPWDATTYRGFIDLFQEALLPAQPPIYNMGNHDKPRLASRIGPRAARTAAMLLLTLPGIPFIYYGDEIGMTNVKIPRSRVRDPSFSPLMGGRDPERTPLQWDKTANAGFSRHEPWLPVAPDYRAVNIEAESADPKSLLNLYRSLLKLRGSSEVLRHGTYRSLKMRGDFYGFVRETTTKRYTVVLNFGDKRSEMLSKALRGRVLLSTYPGSQKFEKVYGHLTLRPHEGVIIEAA